MKEYEFVVVGAGVAGLSAAIEARKAGAKDVIVIEEAAEPGGQLIKQTHKFFGGQEHRAGQRGIDIAANLADECKDLGIDLLLDTVVWGIFKDHVLSLYKKKKVWQVKGKKLLLATGATENPLSFPGWTLPGVLGAGAIQTLMNVHRVLFGKKVLMVGSGNVGLIVSYQLLQAGAMVVGIVEILPEITGYWVHASKIARLSVPIFTSYTIKEVRGNSTVEAATIVRVDSNHEALPGTECEFDVDTVCIAVGLSPLAELAWMCGLEFMNIPEAGGWVPVHDDNMETTVSGIYIAGDAAGVEEACTAMVEGEIVGLAVCRSLGYVSEERFNELKRIKERSLEVFRKKQFEFRRELKEKLSQEKRKGRSDERNV